MLGHAESYDSYKVQSVRVLLKMLSRIIRKLRLSTWVCNKILMPVRLDSLIAAAANLLAGRKCLFMASCRLVT